jgi:catechol 2,3-dioxygenase-like lactoylglutathione lyase family enzyme
MKRLFCFGILSFLSAPLLANELPTRPKITGIDHVRMYVTNVENTSNFYAKILGLPSGGGGCAGNPRRCFPVNVTPDQQIELEPSPSPAPKNWLAEIAFATDDAEQMRRYLLAHGVTASKITRESDGTQRFEFRDPEGNFLSFVQRPLAAVDYKTSANQISTRLLHAGFVVRNLAAENRFYVGLLGFRLYWQGGFKDQDTDWYELQVPDGTDWIEYMLNIPANADHKELGIQNHFSLGVRDIHATADQLRKNGLHNFDGPEIGRDGKWSLDAYDPDGTRIEFMEFAPVQEPCCHPYTAAHPRP